jgi:iron complex outermembrane receptor protein
MRLFIIVFLIGMVSHSQQCDLNLQGRVIDFHDNTPLDGAIVIVAGLETFAMTDLDGYFSLQGLCADNYTLQVSHPECDTKAVQVRMPYSSLLTIKLEHHLEELHQVTVRGSAAIDYVATQHENRISREEIENLSYASLGDALKRIPGVSSLNTGSTVVKPVIQGLHSSRVLIMNNGVRMQDQEWGVEHAPNVDLNTAGSISVIKGASALQYGGDAVGGIVLVEPARVVRKDSLFGSTLATATSNGRGGTITSSLTKTKASGWYGMAQGTIKRFGDFEAPDYMLSNTGMLEKAASLRFGLNKFRYGFEAYYSYFNSDVGILRASHLGNAEDQFLALNSPQPLVINDFSYSIDNPKQNVSHHLAKARVFKRLSNFGKVELQYDFQFNNRLEFDVRRGGRGDIPSVDLELTTHTLAADFSYDARMDFKANGGLMLRYQNNYANPDTGVRRLIPDYDKYDAAMYALGKYYIGEDWVLEAGMRYDFNHLDAKKFYRKSLWEAREYNILYPEFEVREVGAQILANPVFDYHNFSGTLGAAYSFGEYYEFMANYSLATRAPNPSELFSEGLHHSAARIELGDLRFNQEVAHKVSLSLSRNTERFQFTVNPYINSISNFIYIEPVGAEQTIRGSFQVWEFKQTDALLMGFDFDSNVKLNSQFDLITKFAFVKGYDQNTDEPLIMMPPANLSNTLQYKNETLKNLRIGLESNYVFRQNEFPDTNPELFLPISESVEIIDLSTPPPAYHLMHLNADADFKAFGNSTLSVGLTVNNLFNTAYRDYLNRLRFYADDLGRNIVLRLKINY